MNIGADIERLGWGKVGDAWRWRRSLRTWGEDLLVECQFLLHDVPLQDHSIDQWFWYRDFAVG